MQITLCFLLELCRKDFFVYQWSYFTLFHAHKRRNSGVDVKPTGITHHTALCIGRNFEICLNPSDFLKFQLKKIRRLKLKLLSERKWYTSLQICWEPVLVFHKTLISIPCHRCITARAIFITMCILWLSLQVYEILNSAELICLMRYVSIPSTSTAECMVAANQSCKKAGVWIGNGNTEKAQLSFVNLNTDGHTCEVCVEVVIYSKFFAPRCISEE